MALAALCDDTDWGRTWRDVMQHRFTSTEGVEGSLDDHALGNLLIVTLWELSATRWPGPAVGRGAAWGPRQGGADGECPADD
jgi:2-phospho-L-lactate transferase/gluconeogenesis factor (CofD/UPF0052 family)